MSPLPRSLVTMATLLLATLLTHADEPSDACRQHLMRVDHLRQLYAAGAGMRVRVPAIPEVVEGLTAADVYEAAWRKLSASGVHDADATQWLDVRVDIDGPQYTLILSLKRWTENLGYGLPGEMTVWGLGSGDYHESSAHRVIARVLKHMDDFLALYVQAQWTCGR